METPKLDGKYETGQLFLHRVFGYRGVTLFPWIAKVYDRDVPNRREEKSVFSHRMVDLFYSIRLSLETIVILNWFWFFVQCNKFCSNFIFLFSFSTIDDSSAGYNHVGKEVKGHTHIYYQVLIDSRDCPFVVSDSILLRLLCSLIV